MKADEALQHAMYLGCMHFGKLRGWDKPGAVINRMSGDPREALGRLTSDDVARMRVEPWELCDETWARKQEVRKLLSDFDQRSRARSY